MKYVKWTGGIIAVLAVAFVIISATNHQQKIRFQPVNTQAEKSASLEDNISVKNNETFAVKLPDYITFAGEEVPLNNMDVRERLDRELTVNSYWHSSTILMIKRANRWLPIIERVLRENGVPDDFKYLAMAESGLQNVISPAGATGFWQFLKGSGKEHGLVINGEVDERYHVEKATKAACSYLKQLNEQFGSWTMAAAAYNMGQNGLAKQIERQGQSDYYDLILSDETSRYLFRILAIKTIHSSREAFGFHINVEDMYQEHPYKILIVDDKVASWPEFCKQNDITYRDLKLLNPWLREAYLTNTEKREYKVKIMDKDA